LTHTGTNGTQYWDPNAAVPYHSGELLPPNSGGAPPYGSDDGGWGSDYDKKEIQDNAAELFKEDGMIVKEALNTMEVMLTSRVRCWWLIVVWMTTFWMPSFLLSWVGRMKCPNVRLAWHEKVTIVGLIFFLNRIVVFYIIKFGCLLCPNFDKAWALNEVSIRFVHSLLKHHILILQHFTIRTRTKWCMLGAPFDNQEVCIFTYLTLLQCLCPQLDV